MTAGSAPLPCQRSRFDIPREIAYLNCAYMGPLPVAALEAGLAGMRRKARPWSITSGEFFEATERLRALAARLLGAGTDDLAIVPSVSYGMGVAAANVALRAGQRVLLLEEEFPSTFYPWRDAARRAGAEAVCLPRPHDDDWTGAVLAAMDERTGAVALPVCHWTDGGLLDLVRIGERARALGAGWRWTQRNHLGRFRLTSPGCGQTSSLPRPTSGSLAPTPSAFSTPTKPANAASPWNTTGWPVRGPRTSRA
jgi:selenocysteine lyase/cysteine desulfurase